MALWQYHCPIVPNVDGLPERLKTLNDEAGLFQEDILWNECQVNKAIFIPIDKFLKRGKSWSKDIDLYGHQEHNCIEVFWAQETVESVSFRIDFTGNYTNVLERVIDFCICRGLVLLDDQRTILPMNMLAIQSLIEASDQYRKLYWLTGK